MDVDPFWFSSDKSGTDLATMVEGVRISRCIATWPPLAVVLPGEPPSSAECDSDEDIAHYVSGHRTTLHHPSSSRRVGSDAMAVVDPATLKVRSLKGLRLADASVMPRIVSGTLNASTIMIAERPELVIMAQGDSHRTWRVSDRLGRWRARRRLFAAVQQPVAGILVPQRAGIPSLFEDHRRSQQ